MKARLENQPIETELKRGRKPVELKFPRKRHFTVDDVAVIQRRPVSTLTIRKHLNAMTQDGRATARPMKSEGRGHPKYAYTLVA